MGHLFNFLNDFYQIDYKSWVTIFLFFSYDNYDMKKKV